MVDALFGYISCQTQALQSGFDNRIDADKHGQLPLTKSRARSWGRSGKPKSDRQQNPGTLSTDFHLEVFNYFFLTTPVQCQDAPQTNFEVRPTVRSFDAFK